MQEFNTIIDKNKLKSLILEEYGSQVNFAKAIGYTEPQLSKQLNKPSPKFLIKVKKAGINVNDAVVSPMDEETRLRQENEHLRILLEQKEQIIESQTSIIKNYEHIIKTLKDE